MDLSEGRLYPRLLSELETGKRSLADLSVEQAATYMRILEYTPQAIAADSHMEMAAVVALPPALALPAAEDYDPSLELDEWGDVAAGLHPNTYDPEPRKFRIDPNITELRGRPVEKLAVMRVNGDSMVSPKVSSSIPKGARIVVERGAAPQAGDTVVAWIRELDLTVLKRYEEGDDVVLTSLNPRGPVFRSGDHDFIIGGVVRLVIMKPS